MDMSKREQEKAIEDTKKISEQAKSIEDKIEAAETLQEVGQQEPHKKSSKHIVNHWMKLKRM